MEELLLKDAFDNTLYVGDTVAYIDERYGKGNLKKGVVKGETSTLILIDSTRRASHKIVKINKQK